MLVFGENVFVFCGVFVAERGAQGCVVGRFGIGLIVLREASTPHRPGGDLQGP